MDVKATKFRSSLHIEYKEEGGVRHCVDTWTTVVRDAKTGELLAQPKLEAVAFDWKEFAKIAGEETAALVDQAESLGRQLADTQKQLEQTAEERRVLDATAAELRLSLAEEAAKNSTLTETLDEARQRAARLADAERQAAATIAEVRRQVVSMTEIAAVTEQALSATRAQVSELEQNLKELLDSEGETK